MFGFIPQKTLVAVSTEQQPCQARSSSKQQTIKVSKKLNKGAPNISTEESHNSKLALSSKQQQRMSRSRSKGKSMSNYNYYTFNLANDSKQAKSHK